MDVSRIILHGKNLSKSAALITLLGFGTAFASPTDTSQSINLKKLDPNKPATKLEIIAAVKKIYSGRILSVRKGYRAHGSDCHHVNLIDTKSNLKLIRVACGKSK